LEPPVNARSVLAVQNVHVRLSDSSWICNNCQTVYAVPPDLDAVVKLHPVAGERPIRTVSFGGVELHRCTAKPKSARFGGRPKKSTPTDR
jgi:hypothetical protein